VRCDEEGEVEEKAPSINHIARAIEAHRTGHALTLPFYCDPTFFELEFVRGDAREGIDYDVERLTWLWRVTSDADKRIIEANQQGVDSRWYEPGPYSQMEQHTSRFVEWILAELSGGM
jgi:phenylpropionate dioxygenase-like ring-hydroxylating dioxygenase large terminal subunit